MEGVYGEGEMPMISDEKRLSQAVPALVEWYAAHKISMPWREDPTPYHVWISEIMLQQTRIEAAIPYYYRFLEALPDIPSLAAVEDDKLLKLWQGLGYYSRARNLKKAAVEILDRYDGRLPADAKALRGLPGIGDYTAGAIASIAYGLPEPAVDGNVLRVVMRLTACDDDILAPSTRKRVAEMLRAVYPSGADAAALTEGIMELGERVCIPNGEPRCAVCPVADLCAARQKNATDRYPVRAEKKPRRLQPLTVLLLHCGDRYALRRRPDTGLLAGLWEFPNLDGALTSDDVAARLAEQGIEPMSCAPCGNARHIFSHVEWLMQGYAVACRAESPAFTWKTADEIRREMAIPTAFRYYVNLLEDVPCPTESI